MKVELDCDYFNRAGDKVRYVGYVECVNARGVWERKYCLRPGSAPNYLIEATGKHPTDHDLDILGKWEINYDLDRVYVLTSRTEVNIETLVLPEYPCCDPIKFGSRPQHLQLVQKILIKPRKPDVRRLTKDLGCDEHLLRSQEEMAELEIRKNKPNKILPLQHGRHNQELTDKINELIARLNENNK